MSKFRKKSISDYKILDGHTKQGSTFTRFPNLLEETSYVEETLPELIWISILNEALGISTTLQVIEILATVLPKGKDPSPNWFVFCTKLSTISDKNIIKVREALTEKFLLSKIQTALGPFVQLYPTFPVKWLGAEPITNASYLPEFKTLLELLLDKTSKPSTLMLAIAIWGLAVNESILLPPSFSDFNSVIDYPNTTESQILASGLRATMLTMTKFGCPEKCGKTWSKEFWQRGIELEPVDFPNLLRGERT